MKVSFTKWAVSVLASFLFLFLSVNVYAQPANDDCANAVALTIGADADNCTTTEGTTVDGTASTAPASVCSGSWFSDDVWYSITTPATIDAGALVVKTQFGTAGTDVPAVGMAIYEGCGAGATPLACFSDGGGTLDELYIYAGNLQPNTLYSVRVWSGVSPTDNSGTFRICSYWDAPSTDVVLWDGGTFDGGMNGWMQQVTGDSGTWAYKANASSNGSFRSGTISSPTAFNGAMVFDADSTNTPGGVAPPGPPYPVLEGELISPTINLSTATATSVKFFQSYAPLNGNAFLAWSIDDGASWSPNIEISENLEPNALSPIPDEQRIFIPQLAGEPLVRIKFIFNGDFYYWIVDDIQIIEPENNNLVVMENFYAIAPNAMWPTSQVEEFGFLADIANIGAAQQINTTLNMTITDNTTNATVFTDDLNYGITEPDSLYENQGMPGCFLPDGSLTTYTGVYTISSDSTEFDPSDNSRSFSFMTTDTVFAKEQGVTRTVQPAAANWEGEGEPHSWAYGNHFHIVNGSDALDVNNRYYAAAASFGIGNAPDRIGDIITINLYEWTDDPDNGTVGDMDPAERTVVASAFYEVTGFEPSDSLLTIPLNPDPSNGIEVTDLPGAAGLNSDQGYALMVEYVTSTEEDLSLLAAEPWDYAAQTFRTNSLDFPDKPYRPAELLGINGDLTTETYSAAGFNGTVVPAVRLHIGSVPPPVSVNELDEANIIQVSPNPASDFVNLNVELLNTQNKVNIQIMDAAGKLVHKELHGNVLNETFQINVSNYAVGVYFINFITDEGTRTERFIIQR